MQNEFERKAREIKVGKLVDVAKRLGVAAERLEAASEAEWRALELAAGTRPASATTRGDVVAALRKRAAATAQSVVVHMTFMPRF